MKKKYLDFLKNIAVTLLMLIGATVLGGVFHYLDLQKTNVVVVYILSVLLIARFTKGYVYGLSATILALVMFNWFFTEPYFTLKVNDPTYMITFIIMTVTATITSALTTKVKEVAARDKEKQMEMTALYQLTNHLTDAESIQDIAGVAVRAASDLLQTDAACICFDEDGMPESTFIQQRQDGSQVRRRLEKREELKNRMESLHAPADIGSEFYDYPIYGRSSILAVLRISVQRAESITETQMNLLHSVMESTALAMDRLRSLSVQTRAREEAVQERYRSNLLRAISHDIRTPLSGMLGTSEIIMGMTDPQDPRYALAEDIHKDATWLHSLVENILNLTRLQDGRLALKKEPEAVEEVVGAMLSVTEKRFPGREFTVSIPDTLLMVPMDARLIVQVMVNLLDNAVKHTPENQEIAISVRADEQAQEVHFLVSDRGSGIAPEGLKKVFQMFYTTHGEGTGSQRGVGLGLSICQSIVEAHGGTITARNRSDGPGAEFEFTLPMESEATDHES